MRTKGSGTARIRHPQVGELELIYEKLAVLGTNGQLLIIYHAEPNSVTEERLRLLGTLAVTPRHAENETTTLTA